MAVSKNKTKEKHIPVQPIPVSIALEPKKGFQKLFPEEKSPKNAFYLFLIFLLYAVVACIGIAHHEMWRDELEPWLVGSNSVSISDFFYNMSQGSNPYIWYFTLHLLSKISLNPVIVQIAHISIAIAAMYLLLRFSQFTIWEKVLLCFSYYLLFEYAIISRGYSLTIFFLFLFCSFYKKYWTVNIPLVIVIFFLANAAGGFGAILSISFLIFILTNYFFDEMSEGKKKQKIKNIGIATLLILFSIWVAIKSITPPPNSEFAAKSFLQGDLQRFFRVIYAIWSGYVPVPTLFGAHFWNSSILNYDTASSTIRIVLVTSSILLFAFNTLLFSRKVSVLMFYLSATLGILLFFYTNSPIFYIFAKRYHGFLFITYIISLWLLYSFPDKKSKPVFILSNLSKKLKVYEYHKYVFALLLSINLFSSAVAYWKDYNQDFSSVQRTSKYIIENNLQRYAAAGFIDYTISPISAYTFKPFYYPERDSISTFPIWSLQKYLDTRTNMNEIIERLVNYVAKKNDSVLVILNNDLNTTLINNVHFSPLVSFRDAVVGDENFSLYMAHKLDTSMGMASAAKKVFYTDISKNNQTDKVYFQLGGLFLSANQPDSAIFCYKKSIELNPKSADAYNNLGVVYLNLKHDTDKASECWSKAVELNPDFTQGYINLMVVCQNKNDEACLIKYARVVLSKGLSLSDLKSKGINITDAMMQKINS